MTSYFALHPTAIAFATIVVSPVVGSFLGLVIERAPSGRTILWGRSECDACGHPLAPRDLVPVASWIFARGHCRYCNVRLSVFYPLIELAAVLIAVWSAVAASGWRFLAGCAIGWMLLVVAIIDWRKQRKPYVLLLASVAWLAWLYAL